MPSVIVLDDYHEAKSEVLDEVMREAVATLPKGISITHRGVVRLVCGTDYIRIRSDDRIAQASNASFDAATFELWGALLHGATIIGISKDVSLSPRACTRGRTSRTRCPARRASRPP